MLRTERRDPKEGWEDRDAPAVPHNETAIYLREGNIGEHIDNEGKPWMAHQERVAHEVTRNAGSGTPRLVPHRGVILPVAVDPTWVVGIVDPHPLSEIHLCRPEYRIQDEQHGAEHHHELVYRGATVPKRKQSLDHHKVQGQFDP